LNTDYADDADFPWPAAGQARIFIFGFIRGVFSIRGFLPNDFQIASVWNFFSEFECVSFEKFLLDLAFTNFARYPFLIVLALRQIGLHSYQISL